MTLPKTAKSSQQRRTYPERKVRGLGAKKTGPPSQTRQLKALHSFYNYSLFNTSLRSLARSSSPCTPFHLTHQLHLATFLTFCPCRLHSFLFFWKFFPHVSRQRLSYTLPHTSDTLFFAFPARRTIPSVNHIAGKYRTSIQKRQSFGVTE